MDMWTSFPLEPRQWHQAQIGPYILWVLRDEEELSLVSEILESDPNAAFDFRPPAPSEEPPPDKEVRRWIIPDSTPEIAFAPALPDRPVVVRPESSIRVGSGAEATFFVNIPVWIRILAGRRQPKEIVDEPSVRLTNIWFGTPEAGILCYGLRTRARRQFDRFAPAPHRCICPVQIRNSAPGDFAFERMCIRVEYLAVFQGRTRLWTNPIHCVVKHLDLPAQVEYLKTAPAHETIARELTPARKPLKRGILDVFFNNLWTLGES